MNLIKHKQYQLIITIFLTFTLLEARAGVGFCVNLKQINVDYFNESMGMIWYPKKEKWLVWEKTGNIYLLNPKHGMSAQVASLTKNIDVRGDGGLLSLAIHPSYPVKPFIFATRTILEENMRHLVLEKYILDGYDLIERSKTELLRVVLISNYNAGGFMSFDNSGSLLLSVGDGRNEKRTLTTDAANPETLLGSLLRLDVDTHQNKAVAARKNPFLENLGGTLENYAYGFKNPNRFSIDGLTGDIWLSDSGLKTAGEINFIRPGYFYGWNCRDGSTTISSRPECRDNLLESLPVFEYNTKYGIQAIGGYIYRGNKRKNWYGRYFFADYGTGQIWSTAPNKNKRFSALTLAYSGQQINPVSFAQDGKKELFLVDFQGRIFSMHDRKCHTSQQVLLK